MTEPLIAPPESPDDSRPPHDVGAPPAPPAPPTVGGRARPSLRQRARAAAHPLAVLALLVAGAVAWVTSGAGLAERIWLVSLAVTGAPVVWRTLVGMARRQFAADIVASLAIVTAVLIGEPLAGLIVVLMQTGGEALERYAGERASDAVRALEEAAPSVAWLVEGTGVRAVPADQAAVGDLLLVRPGDLVPCDVEVVEGASHVDLSALTGEPAPVRAAAGTPLPSGAANVDGPLTVRVVRPASESRYARIVELVRSAQASKAPLQRLADRYAVWFTPATLAVAAVAWFLSGDAARVLAVLVVATPCPLILATPVAIIGGINRAARRHVVVRHGGALEQVGSVTTVVFDKTGTLTLGAPEVSLVRATGPLPEREVLRLAAAVERGSGHPLAGPVIARAVDDGVDDATATEVREAAGQGVEGTVEGRTVLVGARAWVERTAGLAPAAFGDDGAGPALRAYVAVDGRAAGTIEYADRMRAEVTELLERLRALGVSDLHLMSGDDPRNVRALAAELGVPSAEGGLLPDDKVRVVRELLARGRVVAMVGDGTNDAPALAAATVGIALGGHGGGISAEAADVVLLADDVRGVAEIVAISRRTMRIARQSIWVGLGLSGLAMLFAAAGLVPPTLGALLQEGIDVAVILNALRTSRSPDES